MAVSRAITLRLESDDYELLLREAERLGMAVGTLARVYVRAGLGSDVTSTGAHLRRGVGADALARLAALREQLRRAGHVGVDALGELSAARRELDERRAG